MLADQLARLAAVGVGAQAHAQDGVALGQVVQRAVQRGQIERVLRADGFTRWAEIKWEDGKWEVVSAVAADGRTFGLELSQIDFAIVRREPKP